MRGFPRNPTLPTLTPAPQQKRETKHISLIHTITLCTTGVGEPTVSSFSHTNTASLTPMPRETAANSISAALVFAMCIQEQPIGGPPISIWTERCSEQSIFTPRLLNGKAVLHSET